MQKKWKLGKHNTTEKQRWQSTEPSPCRCLDPLRFPSRPEISPKQKLYIFFNQSVGREISNLDCEIMDGFWGGGSSSSHLEILVNGSEGIGFVDESWKGIEFQWDQRYRSMIDCYIAKLAAHSFHIKLYIYFYLLFSSFFLHVSGWWMGGTRRSQWVCAYVISVVCER